MTDKYAVIGNPIAHSKSPLIHKMLAEQTGQDISYEAVLAPLDGFVATVERLRKEGYMGCNITVPFKQQAYSMLSMRLDSNVAYAHAVNTLKFERGGIEGFNTDGIGLVRDIQQNQGIKLRDKRVLLMGAGGAAIGVLSPLQEAGANITITNRTVSKAHVLARRFSVSSCSYAELAGRQFDIIINATSSGLSDEMPPLPCHDQGPLKPPFAEGEAKISPFYKGGAGGVFTPGALAYDMMYGRETPFMKFAREQGAAIVSDGLGMLVEQAAESFFIWRGVRPDTAPVLARLRAA